MRTKTLLTLIALTAILTVALPALGQGGTESSPTSDGGVIPYIVSNPGPGGNVSCEQLGYDFDSARANYDKDTDTFDAVFPIGITVTVTSDTYVAWTSTFPIGAVIVKGGNDANIYEYIPPSLGDSGLASPPTSSGKPANLSNLTFCWNKALEVSKTAATTFDRTYDWTIDKTGNQTSLTLSVGQQFLVNYTVVVGATFTDSNWAVSDSITIHNPNLTAAATITGVSDVVSPAITATVTCNVTFPYTLPAGQTLICTYSASLPDGTPRTNTATVTTSGKVAGGSGTANVTFGYPTNEYDECIDVSDTYAGSLGTVCYPNAPKTFTYSRWIGPYDVCGDYTVENTASFVTKDRDVTGSDSWTVNVSVPCAGGCTLTPGYWKTHSELGPAPYDDTWALLPSGANTLFPYVKAPYTISYYDALWLPPTGGNAWTILAHAYIAAKLNILNGADGSAVASQMAQAESRLVNYSPNEAPKGSIRTVMLQLATILDNYNNGLIGPGHCDE